MKVEVGALISRRWVAEIGEVGGEGSNGPTMIPVRFTNGSYAVLVQWSGMMVPTPLSIEGNAKWNQLLRKSTSMPVARHGIGSDVLHIHVTDKKGKILLKYFYNEKADRGGEIRRPQPIAG